MRRFKYMLWLLVAVFCLMPCGVSAAETQKDLKIQEVFQQYGKKRNVTMVELSNEMLETYGMTRYKSITIKDDPEALRFTRQCLEADQKGARKIKEVTDDGGVVSAYYQLKGVEADINRFVLFKVSKKGVITLVYIEGDLDSDEVQTFICGELMRNENMENICFQDGTKEDEKNTFSLNGLLPGNRVDGR